ncbi:MAG: PEP-CTERM sorting domain-containing protein [Candidatus Sulfotelmatobacter sp.]
MAGFPRGHAWGLHKHGAKQLGSVWTGDRDNDADDDSLTVVAVSDTGTSDTSSNDVVTASDDPARTPEPSTLALLGLGTMALGLAFGSRRLRPVVG